MTTTISRIFITLFTLACAEAVPALDLPWPPKAGEGWQPCDRVEMKATGDSVIISSGYLVQDGELGDVDVTFRMRAPKETPQVQAWAGFRVADQDHRYVVGLRGGNNNHVYLARYAPYTDAVFLGIAPLDFNPKPGEWYTLRVVAIGKRIQVYLNEETVPRINVEDVDAKWSSGGIAIGGGYLPTEYARPVAGPVSDDVRRLFAAAGKTILEPPAIDKSAKRETERAAYRDLEIPKLHDGRNEIPLDGNWLFKPDQELEPTANPTEIPYDDGSWHVLPVPNLWTPSLAWLYGQKAFPKLHGVAAMTGVSDNICLDETKRLDGYTFDWKKTDGGWYRHYVNLPNGIRGRKVLLHFDAIAKISSIYVNGTKVGDHLGMFGDVACDISSVVTPGRNVIVVHALRNAKSASKGSGKVVAVEVTVEITEKMLNSLPVGMYGFDPGGIWQPVSLVITDPVSVGDVFVQPALDGAVATVELENSAPADAHVSVGYVIRSEKDKSVLLSVDDAETVRIAAQGKKAISLTTPRVKPDLWSPASPNLYDLEISLKRNGKIVDTKKTRFGFRTFAVEGNRFLLNGRPYWLRGGNPFPNPLKPNDAMLAEKFIKLAREGNVEATRTHIAPFTETWADAADRLGMMVSCEGTWPWLMRWGEVPSEELLSAWRSEFLSLIKKYRNHPSFILWTINNETHFYHDDRDKGDLLKRKWTVLSDVIKTVRKTDPTRPIVADSGYMRKNFAAEYKSVALPNGLDDGDVDDAHVYYGWYSPSFMGLEQRSFGRGYGLPDRPLISQEMSSGYPRNDDGLPTRCYLFGNYTPQALVGKYAYENNDPEIFLTRQAFVTRMGVEQMRRADHGYEAGLFPFSYVTWFKNVTDVQKIEPFPTYYGLKSAQSPVLLSLRLMGWHYFAGDTIQGRLVVVNDAVDGEATPAGEMRWEIASGGVALAKGSKKIDSVPYYGTLEAEVSIPVPSSLPAERTKAELRFQLVSGSGKIVAENSYGLLLATRQWAENSNETSWSNIGIYDVKKVFPEELVPQGVQSIGSLANIPTRGLIVAGASTLSDDEISAIRTFAGSGGRVLLLHPKAQITKLLPGLITEYRSMTGEFVNFRRPDSPVFDGLHPLDLEWFQLNPNEQAWTMSGYYAFDPKNKDLNVLADFCAFHNYLTSREDIYRYVGSPLVEAKVGKGLIVASEMMLEAGKIDPIARRLLVNLLAYTERNP